MLITSSQPVQRPALCTWLAGPNAHCSIPGPCCAVAAVRRPAAAPHNALMGFGHARDQPDGRLSCSAMASSWATHTSGVYLALLQELQAHTRHWWALATCVRPA